MITRVYKSYSAFNRRANKLENGVSEEFAKAHPDYEKMNETNQGCYNCKRCEECKCCANCIDCKESKYLTNCYDSKFSKYCTNCQSCYHCSHCRDCAHCYNLRRGVDRYENWRADKNRIFPIIPIIKNIHQKILRSTKIDGALYMGRWHTCDTTHCRAGWVVTLAGEAGEALEASTCTAFAAMMIYKASSPIKVSLTKFFATDTEAVEDIKRCARLEKKRVAK